MEQKNRGALTDILIILVMVIFVFLLCQPLGRKWDAGMKEMLSDEEGVYSNDSDTFFFLRKAKEFTENGFSSIRLVVSLGEDSLMTYFPGENSDSMPVLLSAIAALIWYALRAIGIHVGIYAVAMHLCGAILALCTIPIYLFLRKRVSRIAAVCGAVLGILSTACFQHSYVGVFDTDSLITLCALVIVLSFHECILSKTKKEQIGYGCISMAGVLVLSATWSMFQIYVLIAGGTGIAAVLITRLFFVKKSEKTLKLKIPAIVMAIMVLITLLLGWKGFFLLIRDTVISVKGGGNWPSAYENVTEMARPALLSKKDFWEFFLGVKTDYVSYVGGLIAFLFLAVSVVLFSLDTFQRKAVVEGEREEAVCQYFMAMIWLIGTAGMSFFFFFFTMFLALPAMLFWAYGFYSFERSD